MTDDASMASASGSLRNIIHELAATFASNVLDALRAMSLEEILAATHPGAVGRRRDGAALSASSPRMGGAANSTSKTHTRGGRLPRRSADAIDEVVARIVELLAAHPQGLRAEELREALGLRANEMPRPLKQGLDANQLVKEGEKRATTYFLPSRSKKAKAKASGGKAARAGATRPPKRAPASAATSKASPRRERKSIAPPPDSAKPES
jgi:hypothetical protein